MSYDKEKYYQEHVNTFKNFIKLGVYTSIGVIVLLILMAIFFSVEHQRNILSIYL